jgi:hypothetical protein
MVLPEPYGPRCSEKAGTWHPPERGRIGIVIRKFFLHMSKKEQKKRFLERLEKPEKHGKFSAAAL